MRRREFCKLIGATAATAVAASVPAVAETIAPTQQAAAPAPTLATEPAAFDATDAAGLERIVQAIFARNPLAGDSNGKR